MRKKRRTRPERAIAPLRQPTLDNLADFGECVLAAPLGEFLSRLMQLGVRTHVAIEFGGLRGELTIGPAPKR